MSSNKDSSAVCNKDEMMMSTSTSVKINMDMMEVGYPVAVGETSVAKNNNFKQQQTENVDATLIQANKSPTMKTLCKKVENGYVDPAKSRLFIQINPIEILFENLSLSVQEGSIFRRRGYKCILKGLKGKFESSQLVGILGPSGAGKSSLMNILAGYRERGRKGEIYINGGLRDVSRFRKLSCYIMQDDLLLPYLTVDEAMMVSAHLKLGEASTKTKKDLVGEILGMLGLIPSRTTRTCNLSGGQRKRLAIALELVNNPPVMFFDEPTSGLDSFTSYQVISLLKGLARDGRTIICTIHQPSAKLFELFDRIYILGAGQCIYDGSVPGLVPFLRDHDLNCPQYHNPADYVIEVASGEYGDVCSTLVESVKQGRSEHFTKKFQDEPLPSVVAAESAASNNNQSATGGVNNKSEVWVKMTNQNLQISSRSASTKEESNNTPQTPTFQNMPFTPRGGKQCQYVGTGFFRQFRILFWRTSISILRDPTLMHMRLLSHVIIAVILGLLYLDIGNTSERALNNTGFLFFSILFIMFAALMPTVLTFPMEMPIFVREHLNYWYSMKAYFLSKTFADVPCQIVFPTIYCAIVYFMTGQPQETERFLIFTVVFIMTSLVAQSFGLLIGAASPNLEVATFAGPIFMIPLLLFSGFFVHFEMIPWYLKWISYTSYMRYGFEGVLLSVYGRNRTTLECSSPTGCDFQDTSRILEAMDVKTDSVWIDLCILSAFFVGLRVLAYIILRIRISIET